MRHEGGSGGSVPSRIISLAPSITETLFALGLGSRIVAVTSFCTYPDSTRLIEKVGGYFDPNLERIVALRPDLVILMREHEKVRQFLAQHGVAYLQIDNRTVALVCSSFVTIGRVCGVRSTADSLVGVFTGALRATAPSSLRPRMLVSIGRDHAGSGQVTGVYAAAQGTFYDDLIRAAGGENALPDSAPSYPLLSREGILSLSPDIVVDIASPMGAVKCDRLVADWRSLPTLPAVRLGNVHCIDRDYATVPGPRFILLLEDFRSIIARSASRP